MFRRRAPRPDAASSQSPAEAFTFVHEETVIRGALEARGRVRVDGTVLGDVRVDGVLEVAAGALVEGATVDAAEVRVLGTVRASVTAARKVEIWKHGILEGDVATAALDIEEGATFVGRSVMVTKAPNAVEGADTPFALAAEAQTAADAAPPTSEATLP